MPLPEFECDQRVSVGTIPLGTFLPVYVTRPAPGGLASGHPGAACPSPEAPAATRNSAGIGPNGLFPRPREPRITGRPLQRYSALDLRAPLPARPELLHVAARPRGPAVRHLHRLVVTSDLGRHCGRDLVPSCPRSCSSSF